MGELLRLQMAFTHDTMLLESFIISQGYEFIRKEFQRTQAQAEQYEKEGRGIANSLHIIGLAGDYAIFKDGVYLTNSEDYKLFGEYWKSLNPLNAWGGDFTTRPDGNHFSRSYQGRK